MFEQNGQITFFNQEANNNVPKIILLSLREEYYLQILNGTKEYEFRTRFLREPCTAFIYISKTKKSVVAKIDFGMPIIGNAVEISTLADKSEPGSYENMMKYLYRNIGFALPINNVTPLKKEISLDMIKNNFPEFAPPQSYYILDKKPELLIFFESYVEEKSCSVKK